MCVGQNLLPILVEWSRIYQRFLGDIQVDQIMRSYWNILKPMDPSVPSKMPSLGGPGREVSSLQIFTYLKYFEICWNHFPARKLSLLHSIHWLSVIDDFPQDFPQDFPENRHEIPWNGKSSCYQASRSPRATSASRYPRTGAPTYT